MGDDGSFGDNNDGDTGNDGVNSLYKYREISAYKCINRYCLTDLHSLRVL